MDGKSIRDAVKERYGSTVKQSGSCGCAKKADYPDPDFIQSAATVAGYSDRELKSIPDGANLGLGCGNPVALVAIRPGDVVLDLGSGAGVDCFLASRIVGEKGLVIGVDMTPGMVDRAKANAQNIGFGNVDFRLGEIENLPVGSSTVDIVISNCVINLSTDKPKVFREAWRVMKPGGRLMVSDMVLLEELPDYLKGSVEAYLRCIAGASLKEEYLEAIREAGFEEISIVDESHFPTELIAEQPFLKELAGKMNIPMVELQLIGSKVVSLKVSAKKRVLP
ncbi:MAG: arsenite methyltransferase [Chlorobiaceae bacterium]|nr:arsenite methyltransferase [Chlorobiaceae bacterium]